MNEFIQSDFALNSIKKRGSILGLFSATRLKGVFFYWIYQSNTIFDHQAFFIVKRTKLLFLWSKFICKNFAIKFPTRLGIHIYSKESSIWVNPGWNRRVFTQYNRRQRQIKVAWKWCLDYRQSNFYLKTLFLKNLRKEKTFLSRKIIPWMVCMFDLEFTPNPSQSLQQPH